MSATPLNEQTVKERIGTITDPEIGRTLADLNMIKELRIANENKVDLEIELPTPAYPDRERISRAIQSALQEFQAESNVKYSWQVKGQNTGGKVGLRVRNVIAVGSGKGGVGKSTISAALAFGLNHLGASVGLMDADVYGPSIPHLAGVSGQPAMTESPNEQGQMVQRMNPMDAGGVKLMSMGFIVPPEQAVIWRGPMLHKALMQFVQQTNWGELDYLVIDLPPGTGDVALTLSQVLGLAGAVVVCTPQQVALLDAVKAINMFKQVNIPVLGVVENMSGEVFGRGGAKQKAAEMGVPFLGEVPIDPEIRIKGDDGAIATLYDSDHPVKPALMHVCEQTAVQIAKNFLESPVMPSLEIL